MHFSDENLVAYLDGELSLFKRKAAARHLQSCWQCRTRLAAAERQIQELTKEMEEWSFPGPALQSKVKRRLSDGIREFEARSSAERKPSPPRWWPNRRAWQTAAAFGLLAVMIIVLRLGPEKPRTVARTASATITRAAASERELHEKPLKQTFAVEIVELRPARATRSTRLEVWSDRPTGRFASRLVGNDGALKHAVWQPGNGAADVLYNPAVSSTPIARTAPADQQLPLTSLADYGLDVTQVESAFLRWLESGAGRAVSFTPELAVWSHQDGTLLKAEVLDAAGEPRAIRVTAERTEKRLTAVLRVDYDADSYRPRLQAVRFETPDLAVEFRLAATEFRLVSSTELKSELFSPAKDPSFERASTALPPSLEPPPPPIALPEAIQTGSSDSRSELLEAHYVLHQAGACLGDPVKIEELPHGVRIRSLAPGPLRESFTSSAGLSTVLNAFAEVRDTPPPAADQPDETGLELGLSAALRHAWALTRLARNFPPDVTAKSPPESWRLLEIMVRDHVTFVNAELKPFQAHPPARPERPRDGNNWRHSSSIVLETLKQALTLLNDEPAAKVAPLLQETDAELHVLSAEFYSELERSRSVAGNSR